MRFFEAKIGHLYVKCPLKEVSTLLSDSLNPFTINYKYLHHILGSYGAKDASKLDKCLTNN